MLPVHQVSTNKKKKKLKSISLQHDAMLEYTAGYTSPRINTQQSSKKNIILNS